LGGEGRIVNGLSIFFIVLKCVHTKVLTKQSTKNYRNGYIEDSTSWKLRPAGHSDNLPSRELRYPTLGKGNSSSSHLQNCLGKGYVSSQEGKYFAISLEWFWHTEYFS